MILSRTSQYAVQALIYMATQPAGTPVLNKDIAVKLNVPAPYLAKILQGLAKGNLLYSFRGRTGGFCLREDGGKINLMDIMQQTEGPNFTQSCLLGLKKCSNETACPLHFRWIPVKEKVIDLLQETTLEKLAKAVESGKYRLADLPGDMFPRPADQQ
jgi:Rrf2 family protein